MNGVVASHCIFCDGHVEIALEAFNRCRADARVEVNAAKNDGIATSGTEDFFEFTIGERIEANFVNDGFVWERAEWRGRFMAESSGDAFPLVRSLPVRKGIWFSAFDSGPNVDNGNFPFAAGT